jgi:hypothetical protein
LGSSRAGGGLFENTSVGLTSRFQSPYKEYYEDFATVVSLAGMEDAGWTETAVGTAASRTYAYDETLGLLVINADTVADEGTNIQNNAAGTTSATSQVTNLIGPVVSTTTLMDTRELIWATRIGFLVGNGTNWDSKLLIGWFVTDTALMTAATGALAIGTGGGIGFHINGDTNSGLVETVVQGTTAATTTATGQSVTTLTNATMGNYLDLGFRARWVDAGTGTGQIDFFVNGVNVQTVSGATTALPMQSTQTYSNTIELVNGPATADEADIGVEYIYNAISRAGLTYPYNSGLNY